MRKLLVTLTLLAVLAGCAAPPQAAPTATALPTTAATATAAPLMPTATALEPSPTAEAAAVMESTATTAPIPATGEGGLVFQIVPEQSEARYRVQEQLANVALPVQAVGRTQEISGQVIVNADGTIGGEGFVVNVASLATDQSRRDNYVRANVLQTSTYPNATFVPTRAEGLPNPLPESGPLNFQLIGDLTIRNVTKEVTWEVSGTLTNGEAQGLAVTSFTFAQFELTQPSVPIVLSIEDNITLEVEGVIRAQE